MSCEPKCPAIPIRPALLAQANGLTDGFDGTLRSSCEGHIYRCGERPAPPQEPGVYLFAEGPEVLHVGRTRNLQARRRNHTGPGNGRNTASFAFRLAIHDAQSDSVPLVGSRAEVEADPTFAEYFKAAKDRVRGMDFRCVVVAEAARQAMFEVFASVALGSPHNDWETH